MLMDEAAVRRAKELMEACGRVICCVEEFAEGNQANRKLLEYSREQSLLTDLDSVIRAAKGEPE